MDANLVATLTAVLTFVATVIGSLIAWNKMKKDDGAQFRTDILSELNRLRERVEILEDENRKHAKSVSELEALIEKIRAALYSVLNEDLDEVLKRYHDKIARKP